VVACSACGASYPRSAWAEDAGEREHELGRLLAVLERRGRAIRAGRGTGPRWTKLHDGL
jgi:NMD protein affecting ribosome stability and mRNA decay